jgi:hypothetical protein
LQNFNTRLSAGEKSNLKGGWRYLRERRDKEDPNATRTANSVIESIHNTVEKETLIGVCMGLSDGASNGHNDKKRHNMDDEVVDGFDDY